MRRIVPLLAAAMLTLFALPAFAQVTLTGAGSAVSIAMSPQSPGPDQVVQLTAQSSLYNLAQSSIRWTVDGSTIAQGLGATSAQFTTGNAGVAMTVDLSVVSGGQSASASATIIPSQLDLLFDADSYVPPFYLGRALPSPSSNIVAEAVTRFAQSDGSLVPNSDIIYTWSVDGEVVGSVSGLGDASAILPAPLLDGSETISVSAASQDGTFSASASAPVSSIDPQPTLYEDHPLYGIEYYDALGPQNSITDTEMTFAAIPYFADVQSASDPSLIYTWSVNGEPVAASSSSQNELTIDAQNSNGQAAIALGVRSNSDYLLDGQGAWTVLFGQSGTSGQGSSGASSAGNPFDTGSTQ